MSIVLLASTASVLLSTMATDIRQTHFPASQRDLSRSERVVDLARFDPSPSFGPGRDSLLFASARDGARPDVYRIGLDGSPAINLTRSPSSKDTAPAACGNAIAFVSDRDGNDEVYLMNLDGGQQRNLSRPATTFTNAAPRLPGPTCPTTVVGPGRGSRRWGGISDSPRPRTRFS